MPGISPDAQTGDYTDVVALWGDSMAKRFAAVVNRTYHDTDRPVRQPAGRRTDQDLSSARYSASLEPVELDHEGLRPTDLSARIGATDGQPCALFTHSRRTLSGKLFGSVPISDKPALTASIWIGPCASTISGKQEEYEP